MPETVAWLRRNAVPLAGVDPGPGTDDLAPLDRMLNGVRVVGLGEVTHGTKEFYRLRHRLLRHLVTELGFTVLAIEGSHSSAQVVNDHVVNGVGERADVLAEFGHAMWDVEEFGEALDWLRVHNQSVADPEKVRFCGLDVWNSAAGRAKVLAYLRNVAPERLSAAHQMFREVAKEERQGILLAHRSIDTESFRQVRDLSAFFSSNRARFTELTSPDEYEEVVRQLTIIERWIVCNITDELPDEYRPPVARKKGLNNFARSFFMGQNLIELLERVGPDARIAVWAHSYHVGVGFVDEVDGAVRNMGARLRDHLGDQYYAFAMEFDRGTCLTRDLLADMTLGDHRIGTIPPAAENSLSWFLAKVDSDEFMIDLRRSVPGRTVQEWLTEPRVMHCLGWSHSDPPLSTTMRLNEAYDGVIFVRETSSTTPTINALRSVARRAVH
jgi:erythromycin esterase